MRHAACCAAGLARSVAYAVSRASERKCPTSISRFFAEDKNEELGRNGSQIPTAHIRRRIRHVSSNSDADIVSLPWRGDGARGAGPGGTANLRAGGARDRGGRLCLL